MSSMAGSLSSLGKVGIAMAALGFASLFACGQTGTRFHSKTAEGIMSKRKRAIPPYSRVSAPCAGNDTSQEASVEAAYATPNVVARYGASTCIARMRRYSAAKNP